MAQLVTSPFGVAIVGAHAAGLPTLWAVILFSVAGTLSYGLDAGMTWYAVRRV